jgi:hypothetical protein
MDRDWIKALKVGDKVIRHNYPHLPHVDAVTRITPSGMPVVGNTMFNKDGTERGGETWHSEYIKPWTQEEEDKYATMEADRRNLNFLDNCSNRGLFKNKLTVEQRKQVVDLLKSFGIQKEGKL